jgi:hypothetical protein
MATQEHDLIEEEPNAEPRRRGPRQVNLGMVEESTPMGETISTDAATLGREIEDALQTLAAQTAEAVGEKIDQALGARDTSPDARFARGVVLGVLLTVGVFVIVFLTLGALTHFLGR